MNPANLPRNVRTKKGTMHAKSTMADKGSKTPTAIPVEGKNTSTTAKSAK